MQQLFPEVYEGNSKPNKAGQTRRPATVVASASRSSGAKKSVKLTKTAARLADKFGISHEQYAREYLKLESNNG
jgi:uncharacterized protein (UPF0303 family)